MASYLRPTEQFETVPVEPRPLVPLEVPPAPRTLPSLPSPPRPSLLGPSWTLSTHLVPAAYPRTTPYVPDPELPAFSGDKIDFKAQIAQTTEVVLSTKEKQWRGELGKEHNRTPLWACVNRYVKSEPQSVNSVKGLTLFFAHANGFPKEIWEPMLSHLVKVQQSTSSVPIVEIWVWEAVNHGDSALINSGKLSGIYDWQDNTRDMLHFLLSYLPSSVSPSPLRTHLSRLPESIAASRNRYGYGDRTLVGVGHSYGGCTMTLAAITHPSLFSSLILVDPMMCANVPNWSPGQLRIKDFIAGAIGRRSHWQSRDETLRQFKPTSFFGVWDPAVLDIYVECGLYDDPNGGVRLKMPGIQEAIVFAEALTTFETWQLLDQLDKSIELRWVMPGQLSVELVKEKQNLVWKRPVNSSNIIIPDAGHLIAQETPKELAEDIRAFLQRRYGSLKNRL